MRTSKWLVMVVSSMVLGCGGGDDDPDARRPADAGIDATPVDAAPKVYCIDQLDTACGYTPEELLATEISLADQLTLAEKYNPAQVFTAPDIWSISLDYMLAEGGGLMSAEHDGRLNFSYDVDVGTYALVDSQPDLLEDDYTGLPTETGGGASRGLVYFIDGPGDATGNGIDEETWTAAWRTIQGYSDPDSNDPTAATYPPHQYAHLFWLSKADNLLAIQYWFYYPYDKFQNNHEGDWEHVNVVLDYETPATPILAGFQFSGHGKELGVAAADAYRVADRDSSGGDHLVVFTGGHTCMTYDSLEWCGRASGASFPYPGVYPLGYVETVGGGTTMPGRAVHANDFEIELLPRQADVDFTADGHLSWYMLPFLFGDPIVEENDAVIIATDNHRAPVGPNPAHDEYDVGIEEHAFAVMRDGSPEAFVVPAAGWTMINSPPATIFE